MSAEAHLLDDKQLPKGPIECHQAVCLPCQLYADPKLLLLDRISMFKLILDVCIVLNSTLLIDGEYLIV